MRKKIIIGIIVSVFIILGVAWVIFLRVVPQISPDRDSVENLARSPIHVTFSRKIHETNLENVLRSKRGPYTGPYTIFAPTDSAFQRLPDEVIKFLDNPTNLEDVNFMVLYHVVRGKYLMSDLNQGMTLRTLEGAPLTFFNKKGKWYLNNYSEIQTSDYITKNGVIHFVDDVLLP